MSATLDKIEATFTEQLSEFDGKLREQEDNASLLKEIHAAITTLMAETGDREVEIREILQKRYNGGKLRLETYQLVRNVLDRVVIESMATMPDAIDEPDTDDAYSKTTVIESRPPSEESPQDQLQVGSVLRDRFLLQERVAGGSMGVVYKALDRRIAEADGIDPWVAIKVLSPKLSKNGHALRALQQEAAKGRCLSHPNIVRFIDLDRDDDMYFIVMEWLEGRSLAAILDADKNHNVDRATALDIVRQVGLALDYAHRCGVVHADVKPANVMIAPTGQVKLFDFGIARIKQKQHQTRKDFDPGVLGAVTPAYSSMQVLTGEDPTPADDVFSLGCLMYRLVAGHRVFGPRNAAEAAEQGMEPQRPHGLSDTGWRALKKALAYSRVSRFATPAEFLAALDATEPRSSITAGSITSDDPIVVEPKPPAAEPVRGWGLTAVLVLALAGAITLYMQPELVDGILSSGSSLIDRDGAPERSGEGATAANPPDETPQATGEDAATGGEIDGEGGDIAVVEQVPDDLPPQSADGAGGVAETGRTEDPVSTGAGTPQQAAVQPFPGEEGARGEPAQAQDNVQPGVAMPDTAGSSAAAALPPATVTVPLGSPGTSHAEVDLILREDTDETIVELVRASHYREPLAVLIEEVGFSGNRSPLTTGRYRLSDHMARFEAGQRHARFTISMSSDSLREADRQATLLVRNAANSTSRFAILNLTLEDDDQRAFESGLARDTVGFSDSQLFVSERSPAVQIDVLRFNPGESELEVRYIISGGSAVEGEDYFVPGATGLVFGPGQRSARLLIPLVQDSLAEGEETFTFELLIDSVAPVASVYRQVTVIIQDDDSPF